MLQMMSQPAAAALLLVAARVSGICLVAPVFSASVMPIRLRLAMAIVMAMALVSLVTPGPVPQSVAVLALMVVCELAVGATIGYAARLIFSGVELGAYHIGQQLGFSLSESFRGAGGEMSGAIRPLMWLVAVMVFLAVGGHREVIMALRKSFQLVPLAGFAPDGSLLSMVTSLLGVSFILALKVAAPVLVAMLLAAVAMGLLQRTMPQYNTLSVGLPIRIMVGMLVLAAALAVLGPLMEKAIEITFTHLSAWMAGGA